MGNLGQNANGDALQNSPNGPLFLLNFARLENTKYQSDFSQNLRKPSSIRREVEFFLRVVYNDRAGRTPRQLSRLTLFLSTQGVPLALRAQQRDFIQRAIGIHPCVNLVSDGFEVRIRSVSEKEPLAFKRDWFDPYHLNRCKIFVFNFPTAVPHFPCKPSPSFSLQSGSGTAKKEVDEMGHSRAGKLTNTSLMSRFARTCASTG